MNNNELIKLKENRSHGDFILPFSIYNGEINDNFPSVPIHWHQEIEITIIEAGQAEYRVNLNPYLLKEGDIITIKPEALHSISKLPDNNMKWRTMVFNLNMLKSANTDGCLLKYIAPIINNLHELPLIITKDLPYYNDILGIINNIFTCYDEKSIAYELELKSLLFKYIAVLYKAGLVDTSNGTSAIPTETINKIKQLLNYINDNYTREISVPELAEVCRFSEYHFMRFFKKHIGTSCIQYINNYRLEKSTELLCTTDMTIMEIAFEVGFDNLSYFNKLFKRKYNMTPKEFRKLH